MDRDSLRARISFSQALDDLEEYCVRRGLCPEMNGELRAAVSHWLLCPSTLPPLLPRDLTNGMQAMAWVLAGQSFEGDELRDVQLNLPLDFDDLPYPPPHNPKFTFIDLFAGIGGFRLAMQDCGGQCVFSSEWDKYAKITYAANYGEIPYGDIRQIPSEAIPDHDILCAGFPCQPFSLAGVSKKNSLGRKHGFEDETQGTLFFEIKRILEEKKPRAFFLENVKNLLSHDKTRTFKVIERTLKDELGYVVNFAIVDGVQWVPQHRERIFIVGFDPDRVDMRKQDIDIPVAPSAGYLYPELRDIIQKDVDGAFTLGPGTWATLERHKRHHAQAGNGFGYGLHRMPIKPGETTRTISARYHKDGAEILIEQPGKRPRKLTIKEAMQLQGFDPDVFRLEGIVSNTQAYKQLGNSVVVPAVRETANFVSRMLEERSYGERALSQREIAYSSS